VKANSHAVTRLLVPRQSLGTHCIEAPPRLGNTTAGRACPVGRPWAEPRDENRKTGFTRARAEPGNEGIASRAVGDGSGSEEQRAVC
jgi:hypothetical protein